MTTLRNTIAAHVAGFGASGPTETIIRYPSYTAEQLRPHFDRFAKGAMHCAEFMLEEAVMIEPVDFELAREYLEAHELLSHAGLQRAIRNYQDAHNAILDEWQAETLATRESDRP